MFLQTIFLVFFQAEPVPTLGWTDVFWLLLQTFIALGLVCGLAILIFRYILPRINVVTFNKSIVRIIDGASIDSRKRLLVLEVAGKYMLVAVSENGVQMISELDGAAVEEAALKIAETQKEMSPSLKQVSESFSQIMDRVRRK